MRIAGTLILIALAGCDGGAPPLDELPLRDALRADPAVIATLSDDARLRLATRLEVARTSDDASDPVAGDPAATQPATLVTEADAARALRSSDALIVGAIATGTARALPIAAAGAPAALPPLEVDANAPALTTLESRALQGNAGTLVRGLLAESGAHHLRRVVGWPTGAVAIDDTVYVGAAWLAALAPASNTDGGADAGAPGASPPSAAAPAISGVAPDTTATVVAGTGQGSPDGGAVRATPTAENAGAPYSGYDGGVIVVYPPSTPQPPPPSSSDDSCGAAADSCAACSAASTDNSDSCDGSTDDGSTDSCNSTDDGSDDSCNNTGDGSDDSCNNTGDGTDGTNCQVSRGSRRHGGTSPRMMLSLFVPLAFLFSRRGRGQ